MSMSEFDPAFGFTKFPIRSVPETSVSRRARLNGSTPAIPDEICPVWLRGSSETLLYCLALSTLTRAL